MKKFIPIILFGLIGGIIFLSGCHKIETYSNTPQIEYLDFFEEDSSVSFSFVDGDGDIGFRQGDTIFTSLGDTVVENLFITLYEKVDSTYEEVSLLLPFYFRIPYVAPQGVNKTLKGEINFKFNYNPIVIDTFKFEFYITDNALHKSNIETTPPLTFNKK